MKKPQKTVSIIGAGMAGLAAARALILAGHRVIIYEKSKGLGGRMATRYLEGCTFDHGAQILKPEGSSLDSLMRWELPHSELVEVTQPILPYASDGSLLPSRSESRWREESTPTNAESYDSSEVAGAFVPGGSVFHLFRGQDRTFRRERDRYLPLR